MKFFKENEFLCRCGKCGKGFDDMSVKLLVMLDDLREKVGKPLCLSSAFRCEKHNADIGGVKNSAHTQGKAVDIVCKDSHLRFEIVRHALAIGFRRIEVCPTWIHLDVDEQKAQDVIFLP